MSSALTSHHARVAGNDCAPELLVVGHAAIVERWVRPARSPSMPALGGLESGRRVHLRLDEVLATHDQERDADPDQRDRRGADEPGWKPSVSALAAASPEANAPVVVDARDEGTAMPSLAKLDNRGWSLNGAFRFKTAAKRGPPFR